MESEITSMTKDEKRDFIIQELSNIATVKYLKSLSDKKMMMLLQILKGIIRKRVYYCCFLHSICKLILLTLFMDDNSGRGRTPAQQIRAIYQ